MDREEILKELEYILDMADAETSEENSNENEDPENLKDTDEENNEKDSQAASNSFTIIAELENSNDEIEMIEQSNLEQSNESKQNSTSEEKGEIDDEIPVDEDIQHESKESNGDKLSIQTDELIQNASNDNEDEDLQEIPSENNDNKADYIIEESLNKKASTISFCHKAYDQTQVFKMQPEIIHNAQILGNDLNNNAPYIFGIPLKTDEKKEDDKMLSSKYYCECPLSFVGSSKSYGVLANVVLESASEYALNENRQLDDIKKKISLAEIQNEISMEEVRRLTNAVKEIEIFDEMRNVEIDLNDDAGRKKLTHYITRLFDILKSILFSEPAEKKQIEDITPVAVEAENIPDTDEISINDDDLPLKSKLKKMIFGSVPMSEIENIKMSKSEQENVDDDKDEETHEEDYRAKLKKMIFGSNMEVRKEFEDKICHCDDDENDDIFKSRRLSDDSFVRSYKKSQLSFSEKSGMQKFKNESDLSIIGKKFTPRLSDIEDVPMSMAIDPKSRSQMISVRSIPIISRNIPDLSDLKNSSYNKGLKKCESISSAIADDDDGFCNLPKVPSNELSEVSSSAWINDSESFIVSEKPSIKPISSGESLINEAASNQQVVDEESASAATSGSIVTSDSAKRKSKLRQCKCFLKMLLRKGDKN